jgi:hypothetical protein
MSGMESSSKAYPPLSAPIDRVDIISMAIGQLATAQSYIAAIEEGDLTDNEIEQLEEQAKGCIQQASQYTAIAHRGKRLLIIEMGLPDLDREEC